MDRATTSNSSRRRESLRSSLRVLPLLLCTALAACNSESSPSAPTPTAAAPTPAAPTVTSIRIEGADALRTGSSSDFTATPTLSNGTTQVVSPTWSSSNTTIGAISTDGRLSGVSHGQLTVTATHQGVSSTKPVSVVANFGGRWAGLYAMTACDQSGVFQAIGYCEGVGGVGAIGPIALSISQSGADLSQVTGTIGLGTLTGPVSGNVTGDGRLVLGGSFNLTTSSGLIFTFRVGAWESRLSGASSMTGKWADNLIGVNVPGNAYTENQLQTMTRTSTADAPIVAPQSGRMTWPEIFSAIRRPLS